MFALNGVCQNIGFRQYIQSMQRSTNVSHTAISMNKIMKVFQIKKNEGVSNDVHCANDQQTAESKKLYTSMQASRSLYPIYT